MRRAAGDILLAHGRDPYFPGWPDTLQLIYGNPAAQHAMNAGVVKIAGQCDGVRCDMAMLVLPDVFERTWGIRSILEAIVHRVPPPMGDPAGPLRALVFDSWFDQYRGVVVLVHIVDGRLEPGMKVRLMASGGSYEVEQLGVFTPKPVPVDALQAGEVGFVIAGIKRVADVAIGDTLTDDGRPAAEPLPGFKEIKPMVFAGLYPVDADQYAALREALEKLRLNDSSFFYEPETSAALGFGFRCGFLGLLHKEIVHERLEREYSLSLLTTAPSVRYRGRSVNADVHERSAGVASSAECAPECTRSACLVCGI